MPTPEQKLALIEEYLHNAVASFNLDPPSSEYQRGYLNALKELKLFADTL